jgi:hypothetical protein
MTERQQRSSQRPERSSPAANQQARLSAAAMSRERQVGPVELSRQQIIRTLRRAGLTDVAAAAQKSLPDAVDPEVLDHFCARYGLSTGSLIDRMGGSP